MVLKGARWGPLAPSVFIFYKRELKGVGFVPCLPSLRRAWTFLFPVSHCLQNAYKFSPIFTDG
jgi:hypothetical protein